MQVWSATEPAPGRLENEDLVFQHGDLVGVLDGATVPDGFDTGCVHGPVWYVQHLAARLALAAAARPTATLAGHLAAAILAVRSDHADRCDLEHPGTPSSTVCLLRRAADHVDYLVLCDSPLVVDLGDRVDLVTDGRLAAAATQVRQTAAALTGPDVDRATAFRRATEVQRQAMNQTHGYWVAAANPDAAYHAVTGDLPLFGPHRVRRAALLSDGATGAVDRFGLFDWRGLLDLIERDGPGELIRRVRAAEHADDGQRTGTRFKRYDDASVVLCRFGDERVHAGRRAEADGSR
ncbi:MAG TPA: hypothetical protein VHN18_16910 [Micromonosporaceae bacterium]|nr:hypothetical protein [Micromonosporaceae bacterium]